MMQHGFLDGALYVRFYVLKHWTDWVNVSEVCWGIAGALVVLLQLFVLHRLKKLADKYLYNK